MAAMAEFGRRKRDDALALALAAGQTVRDAAVTAGLGERTATRRWADPAFRQRVVDLRTEAVQRATAKMGDTMVEAVDVLRQLLAAESDSVRLGACRVVLEHGTKLRELIDHEDRLEALERQTLGERGRPWPSRAG
jgi:hypothetical protein